MYGSSRVWDLALAYFCGPPWISQAFLNYADDSGHGTTFAAAKDDQWKLPRKVMLIFAAKEDGE